MDANMACRIAVPSLLQKFHFVRPSQAQNHMIISPTPLFYIRSHSSHSTFLWIIGIGELCLKLPVLCYARNVIIMLLEEAVLCSYYAQLCNGI